VIILENNSLTQLYCDEELELYTVNHFYNGVKPSQNEEEFDFFNINHLKNLTMKNFKLIFEELNSTQLLTRAQMKKVVGGLDPGGILCYCTYPILENGQYGIQWISDTCTDGLAKIASDCGSNGGDCGACS